MLTIQVIVLLIQALVLLWTVIEARKARQEHSMPLISFPRLTLVVNNNVGTWKILFENAGTGPASDIRGLVLNLKYNLSNVHKKYFSTIQKDAVLTQSFALLDFLNPLRYEEQTDKNQPKLQEFIRGNYSEWLERTKCKWSESLWLDKLH